MATNKFSEADVIQNRIALALAKSQRLVASWLPEATPSTKTEQELEEEESAIFAPMPPRLGLGAPLPKEFEEGGTRTRKELSKDEMLRKRMLGKRAGHSGSKAIPKSSGSSLGYPKESSEDEDEGRTGLGKSKRRKLKEPVSAKIDADEYSGSEERHLEVPNQVPLGRVESALLHQPAMEGIKSKRKKKKRKKKNAKEKSGALDGPMIH